jgi:hypothetical protein
MKMWFCMSTAQVTATMERMRVAEEKLLGFAKRFGNRHADHWHMARDWRYMGIRPIANPIGDSPEQEPYIGHGGKPKESIVEV